MIVLDTNVLSETLKPVPSQAVLQWLAAQERIAIFITSVTQAEVLYGVESLPAGKRRVRLHDAIENLFMNEFQGRILSFDEDSARLFPGIVSIRKRLGRPISQFDAMIASICRSRSAAIATRNVDDFLHCGISIVDPWKG
jgi:predicted nucleic acid-binding protein